MIAITSVANTRAYAYVWMWIWNLSASSIVKSCETVLHALNLWPNIHSKQPQQNSTRAKTFSACCPSFWLCLLLPILLLRFFFCCNEAMHCTLGRSIDRKCVFGHRTRSLIWFVSNCCFLALITFAHFRQLFSHSGQWTLCVCTWRPKNEHCSLLSIDDDVVNEPPPPPLMSFDGTPEIPFSFSSRIKILAKRTKIKSKFKSFLNSMANICFCWTNFSSFDWLFEWWMFTGHWPSRSLIVFSVSHCSKSFFSIFISYFHSKQWKNLFGNFHWFFAMNLGKTRR